MKQAYCDKEEARMSLQAAILDFCEKSRAYGNDDQQIADEIWGCFEDSDELELIPLIGDK